MTCTNRLVCILWEYPINYREAEMAEDKAVLVSGLEKKFGDLKAIQGVDLEVTAGETFGFLGPNGAGKSTTINILCTLLNPSAGNAQVAGFDVVKQRMDVRRNIGLVFQAPTLDEYLSAEQNLRFHGTLYGLTKKEINIRMEKVLNMVGLYDRKDSPVLTFSGGMKRRLEIARGLMHSPRVLFLDEPTVGLDPQTRASIWGYINELKKQENITIFLTTHYMDEAENCDRIAIMDQGKIVALDTPEELKRQVAKDRVTIETQDNEKTVEALKKQFDIEAKVSEDAVVFSVKDGEQFVPRLFRELEIPILGVSVSRPTLDDVFMSYTGRTIRDSEASASERNAAHPFMQARRG